MITITDIKPISLDTWTFRWNGNRMYYRANSKYTEVYALSVQGTHLTIQQHLPVNPKDPEQTILTFLKLAIIA